jgi:branched-chain amino acid transport system permease protein
MDVLLSGQLLIAALGLGALYALVALGLNLIYGTMRLLNVAHGEILMLGGYVAYWAATSLGIGPLAAIPLAMALAAALGAAIYRLLFRRVLRRTKVLARIEANSLLVFFGISVVIQNLTALAFTANDRSYVYLDRIVQFGDVSVAANRLVSLAIALAACAACLAFFRLSIAGLAIRALIQQRDAAALVGINVDRVNLQVFALGFALAALAGVLVSMGEQISPFIGFPFTISAFVIVILGGLGNLYGGILGALILAVVEVYGVALTSASFRSILVYGVFIAILLLRPAGLLGRPAATR